MRMIVLSKGSIAKFLAVAALVILPVGLLPLEGGNIIASVSQAVNKVNPIYFVYTEEPKIGISFDATWGAEHTEQILATLEKHQVKATFFLTNIWLKEYPDMAKKIADAGHEIAMHSVSHPHMNDLSQEQIKTELIDNQAMIKEVTGYQAELFRFPFGEYNNQSVNIVKELGFYPIQWSIDSLDWKKEMTKEDIVARVTKDLHNGAIILCHNNGVYTAEALDDILTNAASKGYQVMPVGEVIYKGEYITDHQGGQKSETSSAEF